MNMPAMMRAAVLHQFGGPEELIIQNIPVPEIDPEQILMRVEYAGVGEWDTFEREGGYAQMLGIEAHFPYVLGSEGAGTVAAVGQGVSHLKPGQRVYAPAFLNFKGGFYAEYTAVDAGMVSLIPDRLTPLQASVISGVGMTALRGLEDVLELKPGEAIIILGASGGIGHVAAQMARHIGARVLAVASGEDGAGLLTQMGFENVIDGRQDPIAEAARAFASDGVDAALLTAGGLAAEQVIQALRPDGRAAYPFGVNPEPQTQSGVNISGYNGEPDPEIVQRLAVFLESGAVTPHVSRTFALEQVAEAHQHLSQHYLGKLALTINP
jgi:NADPH:quinone reductase-like Zn-dependent oxidoreductase